MVIETIYDKLEPKAYVPETIDKTTEIFKNKCIRTIFETIYNFSRNDALCDIIASEFEKVTGNPIFNDCDYTNQYEKVFHKLVDRDFIILLDVTSQIFDYMLHEDFHYRNTQLYDNYVDEINHYLKIDNIGLKLIDGKLCKVDEMKITNDIVIPCFDILHRNEFTNPDLFLKKAFDDYKNGNNPSAITSATCAFESLINEIMDREKIKFEGKNNNISKKMESLKNAGITPKYMGSEWTNLIDAMHQPFSVRNKENGAAHGNSENIEISDCMARFTINMIAVDIKLICDLYEEYKAR